MNTAISQRFKDKTGSLDKATVIQNSLAAAKAQIAANAALGIDPDRLIAIVASAVIRTPALLSCTPQSIVEATIKAARYGLDPSGITGDGFLVPFKDRAEFICGYRGLVKLAMRHPRVKLVEARLVHANDKFEIDFGRDNPVRHKIALKDRGDPIGCYARAFLDGSPPAVEWMDADEINRVRNQSKSYQKFPNDSPWTHHWGEMARKTVLRRMIKFLPLEFEISLAVADLDAVDYPQFAAPAVNVLSGNGAKPIAEEKPEKPKAEAKAKKAEAPAEDVEVDADAGPYRVYAEKIKAAADLEAVTAIAEGIKQDDTLSQWEVDELLDLARNRYQELKNGGAKKA